ncbi:MAG: methyltransferase domain-containing protein [Mastigocoleus sp.]
MISHIQSEKIDILMIVKEILKKIYILFLGQHPHNTFLSFNYHNISHINKYIKREIKNIAGSKKYILADIGSGKSPYYQILSEISSKYVAVDMKDNLPENETRSIEQVYGVAEEIPLENSTIDIVLCNQVLEHVNDPIKSVDEIYRILKPGGKFIGSLPHVSPVHLEPYDFRRYTDLGLKKLLDSAGYTDIKIEGSGGVHSAAALMITMDWMLNPRKEGIPQSFSPIKAFLLSPIVGFINLSSSLLDFLIKDKGRTPANLCWTATKPFHISQINN